MPVIDVHSETNGKPEYFVDGVHPGDAGYAALASLIQQGLEREPAVQLSARGASLEEGDTVRLIAEPAADATVD